MADWVSGTGRARLERHGVGWWRPVPDTGFANHPPSQKPLDAVVCLACHGNRGWLTVQVAVCK